MPVDPYEGMQPDFSLALHKLIADVSAQGGSLSIASGKRDTAEQTVLYNNAVKKYGAANAANWAAPPGHSNHEKGLASDIHGDDRSMQLAHNLAGKYGLNFPLANEAWHVEPIGLTNTHNNNGGPVASGPPIDGSGAPPDMTANTPEARMDAIINMLGGKPPPSEMPNDAGVDPNAPSTPTAPTATTGTGGGEPSAYDAQFQAAGQKYGISAALLKSVAKHESGFNPNASNSSGARGLMQFMPDTAKGLGVNPMDPNSAIDGAARMLSGLMKQFGGSTEKALAAYNAGAGAVQKYGGIPPFKETQHYVSSIMSDIGGQ